MQFLVAGFEPLPERMNAELLAKAKSLGFSDRQIAHLTGQTEDAVRAERKQLGLVPSYRLVDTCAAEFEAYTPYYYSTYDRGDDEVQPVDRKKVMILGGGPNRIGQGIEFDYCCVHAAFALKEDGFETLMVNSNPETVSTDYDTSDKLYFEPLTLEDVLHIYEREKCWGAIAQFGGQTPLNLALGLQKNGVNIIGTSPQSIEIAEDRKLFAAMLTKLDIPQPPNGIATNEAEALAVARRPSATRSSCAPASCSAGAPCRSSIPTPNCSITCASPSRLRPNGPCWWTSSSRTPPRWTWIASPTSAHFSDPSRGHHRHRRHCSNTSNSRASIPATPPWSCRRTRSRQQVIEIIREYTHAMARELKVVGLMNVQYAVKDDTVYVLEVNPRASRTVPFVSKAIGVPLAKLAARVMAGKKLKQLGFTQGSLAPVLGGQGIRLPLQPLPRPGHPALARDAFDRRSHGPRRRSGHRLRQIADGRRRPPARGRAGRSSASATRTRGRSPRLAGNSPSWASSWSPPAARPTSWRRPDSRCAASSSFPRAGPTRSISSRTAKSRSSSTPPPAPPRTRTG